VIVNAEKLEVVENQPLRKVEPNRQPLGKVEVLDSLFRKVEIIELSLSYHKSNHLFYHKDNITIYMAQ